MQRVVLTAPGCVAGIPQPDLKRWLSQMETFEEYLAAKRTRSTNGSANGSAHGSGALTAETAQKAAEAVRNARSHMRAVKNWRRAKYAVTKKITEDMLGVQRRSTLSTTPGSIQCTFFILIMTFSCCWQPSAQSTCSLHVAHTAAAGR